MNDPWFGNGCWEKLKPRRNGCQKKLKCCWKNVEPDFVNLLLEKVDINKMQWS